MSVRVRALTRRAEERFALSLVRPTTPRGRGTHRRYWTRVCAALGREWSEDDDEIDFERFCVVWPPERADVRA